MQCHQDLWETAKKENKTQEFARLGVVVEQIDHYMKSIHARPNREDQSRTNATCYNCHDAHYVYPKDSPDPRGVAPEHSQRVRQVPRQAA